MGEWEVRPLQQPLPYDPTTTRLFQLNSDYLWHTGLDREHTGSLILYCQPLFHQQFAFLREQELENQVLLLLSLQHWIPMNGMNVTWIHLNCNKQPVFVLKGQDSLNRRNPWNTINWKYYPIIMMTLKKALYFWMVTKKFPLISRHPRRLSLLARYEPR